MHKSILIIDGHPDPDPRRFCHALADAYETGARQAGHSVQRINIAQLEFPLLRKRSDWEGAEAPAPISRMSGKASSCKSRRHNISAVAW